MTTPMTWPGCGAKFVRDNSAEDKTMTEQEQIRVLRNELAIIIGCDDGRSAQEKAGAVIAWIDKHDQRASIQPVAPEPDAWMHNNLKPCTTAASKRWMENAGFGAWAEVAASYTIPLYTAAPAQAWTALTPEELVMANEAIRQMAHGFMPNTVGLFRRLVAAAPAQVAPDEVREPEGWRDFIENIATPCSEPLNSVSGYRDLASRKEMMRVLRGKAQELLRTPADDSQKGSGNA